jgi:putative ABC transport system permease protein
MRRARVAASSLRALRRYRLRSAFMMLGSLVGVAALTVVLAAGSGAERKVVETLRQIFGASSITVYAGGGLFRGGPRTESRRLTIDDIEAVAREVPAIEAWDPVQVSSVELRHGERTRTVRLEGHSERAERVWDRGVSRGEYFDAAAVAGSARVALVGETVARELFAGVDPLAAEVRIGPVPFRVVGVLEAWGTDAHGLDRDDEVIVPITTAMRRVLNVDTIRLARLAVDDPGRIETAVGGVNAVLRDRHAIAAGQPDDFTVMTSLDARRIVARARRVFFVYLPLAAAVSFLVGGVVAATLMLASVSERVGEIGLRRAVGARPADVSAQFLLETAMTNLAGGSIGLLVGIAIARFLAARLGVPGTVSAGTVALGLVLAALTGLLAGVVPARRAARLPPAEALR